MRRFGCGANLCSNRLEAQGQRCTYVAGAVIGAIVFGGVAGPIVFGHLIASGERSNVFAG
jgi:hypothetical protein